MRWLPALITIMVLAYLVSYIKFNGGEGTPQ